MTTSLTSSAGVVSVWIILACVCGVGLFYQSGGCAIVVAVWTGGTHVANSNFKADCKTATKVLSSKLRATRPSCQKIGLASRLSRNSVLAQPLLAHHEHLCVVAYRGLVWLCGCCR